MNKLAQLTNENLRLKEEKQELLKACKWAKDVFIRLANEGRYPDFLITTNGGGGIMPLASAIKKYDTCPESK